MSDFEARYHQIEDYLKGKLSNSELDAFEQELVQNEALREEVAIQKIGFEFLEMDYLSDVSQLIKKQTAKPKKRLWKWIGVGALISLTTVSVVMNRVDEKVPSVKKQKSTSLDTIIKKSGEIQVPTEKIYPLNNTKTKDQKSQEVLESKNDKRTTDIGTKKQSPVLIKEDTGSRSSLEEVQNQIEQKPFVEQKVGKSLQVSETESNGEKPLCINKPKIEVKIQEASADSDNGRLTIVNKSKAEFQYKINEGEFQSSSNFMSLKGDKTYRLQVKDSDLCVYDFGGFNVEKSICQSVKEYSYNMTYDENWRLELSQSESFEISIFNKLGKEVVAKQLKSESEFEWNGYYDNNQKAALGIHVVYVKSQTGKMCKYNVVVSE